MASTKSLQVNRKLVTQAMVHDVVFLALVHLCAAGSRLSLILQEQFFCSISLYSEQCYLMLFIIVIVVKGGDSSGISCPGETPQ